MKPDTRFTIPLSNRCPGYLEQFSSARHALGFYRNVAVSALYSALVPSIFLQKVIYSALGAVIRQHSILSTIVIDEDTTAPYFARLPRIDLDKSVRIITRKQIYNLNGVKDSELDDILEEQHNTDFKEHFGERPFWRFIILTEAGNSSRFVASFVFHHAIGDGQSGLAFHRAFFSALSEIQDVELSLSEGNENSTALIKSPEDPLIPSLKSLHKLPLSVVFILKALWNSWFPGSTRSLWMAHPMTNDPSKRRARYRSFAISQDTTQSLLNVSRIHSTTITATIEVLLANVLFSYLPSEYSALRCDGAISLRRCLPTDTVNEDSIGTWLSTYTQYHYRSNQSNDAESFFWAETKKVKSTINAEVAKDGKNSAIGLLRYAGDIRTYLLDKIGKQRDASFEISNVGLFRPHHLSPRWKIGKMVFSQSSNVVGPPITGCIVTGGDGCLSVSFSWLEGIVEEELVKKVMLDMQIGLEKLGKVDKGQK
jgi:hypothetical protein